MSTRAEQFPGTCPPLAGVTRNESGVEHSRRTIQYQTSKIHYPITIIQIIPYFYPPVRLRQTGGRTTTMTQYTNIQFSQLDYEGLKTLVAWAQEEGWNPGPHDAEAFWAADPDGFVGCFLNGELIGGGSIVSYNGHFGFMGFFIVKPEYRAEGIGRQLWYQRRDMLLARLRPGAPIGMDGVPAMQPFYTKGGFTIAFRNERYETTGRPCQVDEHISPVADEDIPALLVYDRECFGYDRRQFMLPWLRLPGNHTFKYMHDGELKGFAILRKAGTGYKIGPLFARDAAIADALYLACHNAVPGQQLYIDIPVANTAAQQMVQRHNATYVFECARMYYGTPSALPVQQIFGITSFELG